MQGLYSLVKIRFWYSVYWSGCDCQPSGCFPSVSGEVGGGLGLNSILLRDEILHHPKFLESWDYSSLNRYPDTLSGARFPPPTVY